MKYGKNSYNYEFLKCGIVRKLHFPTLRCEILLKVTKSRNLAKVFEMSFINFIDNFKMLQYLQCRGNTSVIKTKNKSTFEHKQKLQRKTSLPKSKVFRKRFCI